MADPTWPAGVNDKELLQETEQPQDDIVRSVMSSGVPKIRPRSTLSLENVDVPMIMTTAEKDIFRDWYKQTLARGSLAFQHDGPNGPATRYQFRQAPTFGLISPDTYRTTLQLLIVP